MRSYRVNNLIVIPFNLPWEWSTDYLNQTALVLSKNNLVFCYMWHEVKSFKDIIKKRKLPQLVTKKTKNLFIYTPHDFLPFVRFRTIQKINFQVNILILKLFMLKAVIARHINKKVCWVFYPTFWEFYKLLGKKYYLLYDCVDYFSVGEKSHEIKGYEDKLLQKADLVVTISQVLKKHLAKTRKEVSLVPQGFRFDDFKKFVFSKKPISGQKKPIIGYVGGMNERLNYGLLLDLAIRNPDWQFVLWGPFIDQSRVDNKMNLLIDKIINLPNITYGVSKQKSEIPSVISQFDIGMIPYDSSQDFNRYCYPMKLFEYFYMGIPVISTPIEELKRFPKYVRIGNTCNEWERIIKQLLKNPWPKNYKNEQKILSMDNSWENKIKNILSLIETRH